ncbi:SMC family ATPase [Paenibacillus antri]|uniref:Nuclease SbcCD subunit C n=1 Tax=Paenibacillus antri TaxID=2582848 RepID=A0A5R9GB42_9BACL|nr:AAA family ATPase [Paenibacillus antri]TLS50334.1 SMC family ATPase [Paenibacillus antri]
MKPIRLTIQGLQSYREEQTIDFSRLAEAGVFGIFGPTGSGKSTILDAVTLAMYGAVERAGSGIQSIMNAQEDTLSVSFAFQLSDGADRRTYRAERTYRRKPDGTVEQRLCRLCEETSEGAIVLADKAGEVNAAVASLIGLSMTDFTRAVVLPQGKFSEFLALKGKERREMLQRLFRLERYGDELAARLTARLRRTEALAREAAAELQGLGDASPEALAAAEAAFRDASEAEARLQEALKAAETAHAEAARIREAMQEAAASEAAWAALERRRPEIAAIEERLAAAAAAEALLPTWRAREEAAAQADRLAREAIDAAGERERAAARQAAAQEAHAAAERVLREQEAPTAVRLERLRQAVALAEQAAVDAAALERARAELASGRAEREAAANALAAAQQQRAKALQLQAELKAAYGALAAPPEERRRMAAAERERSAATTAAAQAAAQRGEASALAAAAKRGEAETARLDETVRTSIAQLGAARALFAQGAAVLNAAEDDLLREERRLGERILAAKTAAIGGERHAWAHALAAGLAPGEPCPVCGSASHPAPASPPPDAAKGDDEAERLERLQRDARELASAVHREAGRANEALHRLNAALEGSEAPSAVDETAAAAEEPYPAGDASESPQAESLEKRRRVVEKVVARLNAVAPELKALLERFESARASLRNERATLAAAAQSARAAETKAEAAEREAAIAAARWREAYPEWTPETFEQALRDAERKEREAEDIRLRLEKSEPFLAANAEELERLQGRQSLAERRLALAEAETAAAERQLAARREEIAALTGGDVTPPAELAAALSARLERWRADERAAREAADAARTAAENAGRRLAAAEEALRGAADARERAERQWSDALAGSAFDGVDAVQRAALEPERREAFAREASAYKEALAAAAAKREAALARLGGRAIDEAAMLEAERRLADAKAKREEALAARAKAERAAWELRQRHERWRLVTRQREEAVALQQQLAKLQAVFRGNAFVEFLAEEQLLGVTRAASERLGSLTRGRYAIELDSTGGFVIRDDANGGVRRPVSTLSGGETFLTSLALALALSAQIQLSGKYPLEFFFLDEGFGTLDPELLDNVVTALERLHVERLAVGVISHVPELQARLPRKLIVTPADPMGAGSRVRIETT